MKYLLPKELGGGEREGNGERLTPMPGLTLIGFTFEGGSIMWLPESKLTPVSPPIPTEPPPGAYLIGGHLAVLFKGSTGRNRWSWETPVEEGTGDTWDYDDWDNCWNECGGPDVTIQRLVPEPAKVELPWHGGPFAVEYSPRGMGSGTPHTVAVDTIGDRRYIRPSVAREMAAALLTAAGAQ